MSLANQITLPSRLGNITARCKKLDSRHYDRKNSAWEAGACVGAPSATTCQPHDNTTHGRRVMPARRTPSHDCLVSTPPRSPATCPGRTGHLPHALEQHICHVPWKPHNHNPATGLASTSIPYKHHTPILLVPLVFRIFLDLSFCILFFFIWILFFFCPIFSLKAKGWNYKENTSTYNTTVNIRAISKEGEVNIIILTQIQVVKMVNACSHV